jgi:hypothetical protein
LFKGLHGDPIVPTGLKYFLIAVVLAIPCRRYRAKEEGPPPPAFPVSPDAETCQRAADWQAPIGWTQFWTQTLQYSTLRTDMRRTDSVINCPETRTERHATILDAILLAVIGPRSHSRSVAIVWPSTFHAGCAFANGIRKYRYRLQRCHQYRIALNFRPAKRSL